MDRQYGVRIGIVAGLTGIPSIDQPEPQDGLRHRRGSEDDLIADVVINVEIPPPAGMHRLLNEGDALGSVAACTCSTRICSSSSLFFSRRSRILLALVGAAGGDDGLTRRC